MDIKKHFDFEAPIGIKFLQLEIEDKKVDSEYFINKIEEGIKEQNNYNYKTNVNGQMTCFKYFNQDKKLSSLLNNFFEYFPKNLNVPPIICIDAWGIKCNDGDYTDYHNHDCDFSSILYLNDSETAINFPQINTSILPKKNNFLFFSAILQHGTEKIVNGPKYAIVVNFQNKKKWS